MFEYVLSMIFSDQGCEELATARGEGTSSALALASAVEDAGANNSGRVEDADTWNRETGLQYS
ncbi:hypothetical protein L195_g026633 [Trifolium pratense]|uniref:Uncharacterized protein n=1 Tax=Trifolium pratense TaxID=57577 RepID=A0A2K3NJT3_TRIPR|nr:hypothetical protein L195_g026633 [Trifolium pratense]